MSSPMFGLSTAQEQRRELSERNQRYAGAHLLPHVLSYGDAPVVVFEPYEIQGAPRHGNFLPATYAAILANPQWQRRLLKPHTQARRSLPCGRRWMELDTSTSSDALLMNVFCYPRVFADDRLRALLGVQSGSVPEFGVPARVPLCNGKFDRTEIDMRLGDLIVEAKLTETDFQYKSCTVLNGYRDFTEIFDQDLLPLKPTPSVLGPPEDFGDEGTAGWTDPERTHAREPQYAGYQLIRNVLAAYATGFSFCVVHDARRPDLREAWYSVMRAVRPAELRTRCKVLTWQEMAQVLPPKLQRFLAEKYGIQSALY